MVELDEVRANLDYERITANSIFGELTCSLDKIRLRENNIQLVYSCIDNEGHSRFFYYDIPITSKMVSEAIELE